MEQIMEQYKNDIEDFKKQVQAFTAGELDKKTYKGISGGFGSYAQRDQSKNMLRLRIVAGELPMEKLKFVADLVEKYEVTRLKLTTGQTIQLHNLQPEVLGDIMEEALQQGIITRGGGGDFPRNVQASPLAGVEKEEYFNVLPYAKAATDYLVSILRTFKMPRKLKIAFCGGAENIVHATIRDMGFVATKNHTFDVYICGGMGPNPRMGLRVAENVSCTEILYYIRAMIDVFLENGNYTNRAKSRTRYMQETLGTEGLTAAFHEKLAAAKALGGLDIEEVTESEIAKCADGEISAENITEQKQSGLYTVAYHPIGGNIPIDMPAKLYQLLKDMEQAECRLSPEETIYILNLNAKEAKAVNELIYSNSDTACTDFGNSCVCIGASICQQGVRDSQAAFEKCAEAVRKQNFTDGVLPKVGISGCPSSCAAHLTAQIGFQGCVKMVNKVAKPAFKMFIGGCDTLYSEKFGTAVGTILQDDMPEFFVELGKQITEKRETWKTWIPNHQADLEKLAAKYTS